MYLKILTCKSQEFLSSRHLYACFYRSTTFTFEQGFVAYSTIQTIFGCIIAAGQITHRIPAISNWNLFGSWEYGYKPNFSKSVILSISDFVPDEGRDSLEDKLPSRQLHVQS